MNTVTAFVWAEDRGVLRHAAAFGTLDEAVRWVGDRPDTDTTTYRLGAISLALLAEFRP